MTRKPSIWSFVLTATLALLPAVAQAQTLTAREDNAIRWLRVFVAGEETFQKRSAERKGASGTGEYATSLDELWNAQLLHLWNYPENEARGYAFGITGTTTTFDAVATPKSGTLGRSFLVDETGAVRSVALGKPTRSSPVDDAATRRLNEAYAVDVIRTLLTAQQIHREHHSPEKTFAPTLQALARFLPASWLGGTMHGYRLSLSATGAASVSCTAVPITPEVTGTLSFFADESGVIRVTRDGSPPTPTSPMLEDYFNPGR